MWECLIEVASEIARRRNLRARMNAEEMKKTRMRGYHSNSADGHSITKREGRSISRITRPSHRQTVESQQASQYGIADCHFYGSPSQVASHQPVVINGIIQGYQNSLSNVPPSLNRNIEGPWNGNNVLNTSGYHLPSSPESLRNTPPDSIISSVAQLSISPAPQFGARCACLKKPPNVFVSQPFTTTFTTSPTSTNTRSIAATNAAPAKVLYTELSFRCLKGKTEFHGVCPKERQQSCGGSPPLSRFNPPVPYNAASNTLKIPPNVNIGTSGDNACVDRNSCLKEYIPLRTISGVKEEQHKLQPPPVLDSPVVPSYRLNNAGLLEADPVGSKEGSAIDANVAIAARNCGNFKQQSFCAGRSASDASLVKHAAPPQYLGTISPTSDIVTEMKYETQSGPPAAPPHLTSSGVEPPHSSQGAGIVVGSSPEIDNLLLPWTNGPEFLEGGVPDAKQTSVGFQDNWDSILGSTVAEQSLPDVKLLPLPPFTNYTGHLQINGIPGHHYHTIASSGQRSSIEVGSASPTPSNQEFFESPVVSSSTPCPQASQKQQQQQQQQQNHQQPQHHHPHNQQQQQQLPQSTQQINYEDMEDIAQIIGSAIADTTVPGNGNGPSSEQDTDASRDWIDIADWITDCSPKTQETTSPSTFASHQIYVTTTPPTQTQQHAGSALQNLLTQKLDYAPLLQARLQAGNAANLQNASCGETPSSTSPFPPLSPPNRVSTSCSPDEILHSSFATPSHPKKRSRAAPIGGPPSKKSPAAGAAALPYGTDSGLMSGKDKPVHRCHICQRGFLNKSNIKVHLRTHTGEKPFRCEVCSKAFRQKAHLIKHQQIHKRIGRD